MICPCSQGPRNMFLGGIHVLVFSPSLQIVGTLFSESDSGILRGIFPIFWVNTFHEKTSVGGERGFQLVHFGLVGFNIQW